MRQRQTPFTPHLPTLSISARLFCPGNAPVELPAEEANIERRVSRSSVNQWASGAYVFASTTLDEVDVEIFFWHFVDEGLMSEFGLYLTAVLFV